MRSRIVDTTIGPPGRDLGPFTSRGGGFSVRRVPPESVPQPAMETIVVGHSIVHWEIGGPDGAVLGKFYSEAFGWTVTPADNNYALVDTGGGLPGGIMQTQPGMPSYVTIYIEVTDLAAKLAEVERLGGRTLVPPTAISDSMSFALFTDPGGAVVGLLHTAVG